MKVTRLIIICIALTFSLIIIPQSGAEQKPLEDVPPQYVNKHMPKGWWTDSKIIEEGKTIYQGEKYGKSAGKGKEVNCSKCHGSDGQPVNKKNIDFRDEKAMSRMSDSYLFWKITEGVPRTKMSSFKNRLSEEDNWKVIAYLHTFSHGGTPEVHDHSK